MNKSVFVPKTPISYSSYKQNVKEPDTDIQKFWSVKTITGQDYERELKENLTKEGWLVFRSAGSHGADLIALKPTEHRIIEVKSTKEKQYNTTLDKSQFTLLNNIAKEGFNVWYYIRWKGKKEWSWFKLPLDGFPIFRK